MYSLMTLDSGNKVHEYKVYADIRSGSQDLCKFSLCLRPYIGYVFRKRRTVVIFNFKGLFMTVSYQYGCRVS